MLFRDQNCSFIKLIISYIINIKWVGKLYKLYNYR